MGFLKPNTPAPTPVPVPVAEAARGQLATDESKVDDKLSAKKQRRMGKSSLTVVPKGTTTSGLNTGSTDTTSGSSLSVGGKQFTGSSFSVGGKLK